VKPLRSLELFSGAGGLALGLSRAGFHRVALIELDGYCCDTLNENKARGLAPLASWNVVQKSVTKVDFPSGWSFECAANAVLGSRKS
jgi:DNA (cytosine-5)-methyltransferase 1